MKHILVTGIMGSGKSSILMEYILNFDTLEFTNPPVEAKFKGMDFEFIDNVFAIEDEKGTIYNFYELDAPTIKKWTQFVSYAHGIIIVSNQNQSKQFSSPSSLMDIILEHAPTTPILFVANNYTDLHQAKEAIRKEYRTAELAHNGYEILGVAAGEKILDERYGMRCLLNPIELKKVIEWHLPRVAN